MDAVYLSFSVFQVMAISGSTGLTPGRLLTHFLCMKTVLFQLRLHLKPLLTFPTNVHRLDYLSSFSQFPGFPMDTGITLHARTHSHQHTHPRTHGHFSSLGNNRDSLSTQGSDQKPRSGPILRSIKFLLAVGQNVPPSSPYHDGAELSLSRWEAIGTRKEVQRGYEEATEKGGPHWARSVMKSIPGLL